MTILEGGGEGFLTEDTMKDYLKKMFLHSKFVFLFDGFGFLNFEAQGFQKSIFEVCNSQIIILFYLNLFLYYLTYMEDIPMRSVVRGIGKIN